MAHDTHVTVYYGPLTWFKQQLGDVPKESLLEIAYAREEALRQLKVVTADRDDVELDDQPEPPGHVFAESSDYASLNEHVITNFAGFIRSINPTHLYLHNPPIRVQSQLERAFPTTVERYTYPAVTRDTLIQLRDNFADHLVGQEAVREALLAALYSLTTRRRTTPVVLMFYGPSGVGKTETAEFVNGLLGGDLLRKQFSMFHNDKFASYLFGGTHSESSFARDLLDRESGVILIDEFDKANPVFHSAFYQFFDGGVFEDKNYSVQLGPSLIICTSNYNSEKEISDALGDALFSRFDSLVCFQPLSREEIGEVAGRLIANRVSDLSYEEREVIDISSLLRILGPGIDNATNVRKLGKLIDELISLILVRSLLEGNL